MSRGGDGTGYPRSTVVIVLCGTRVCEREMWQVNAALSGVPLSVAISAVAASKRLFRSTYHEHSK